MENVRAIINARKVAGQPVHNLYSRLVRLALARSDTTGFNILMTGPAGAGKSKAAYMLAEDMGLPFSYLPQINMAHELVGSVSPVSGKWQHTALTRAALHGGVVVFEEYDAWGPRPMLAANPILANRIITDLETGETIPLHKDCIILAAANTWGQGATMEYVGRNKLDAAALDRFDARLHWKYDEQLERAISGDHEVADFVQLCRSNAAKANIKVLISPRATLAIAKMAAAGFGIIEAAEMSFLAGLGRNDRAVILEGSEMLIEAGDNAGLPFKFVR
jgi:hypothetical protein